MSTGLVKRMDIHYCEDPGPKWHECPRCRFFFDCLTAPTYDVRPPDVPDDQVNDEAHLEIKLEKDEHQNSDKDEHRNSDKGEFNQQENMETTQLSEIIPPQSSEHDQFGFSPVTMFESDRVGSDYEENNENMSSANDEKKNPFSQNRDKTRRPVKSTHRRYSCFVCADVFTNLSHLKEHLVQHKSDAQYKCLKCDQVFSKMYQLREHIALGIHEDPYHLTENVNDESSPTESGESEPIMYLPVYKQCKSYKRDSLRSLTRRNKFRKTNKIACTNCERLFKDLDELKRHKLEFGNKCEKQLFTCCICEKSYGNHAFLHRHMMLHTQANTRQCLKCDRTFQNTTRLKEHIKRHHNPVRIVCPKCGKCFKTR